MLFDSIISNVNMDSKSYTQFSSALVLEETWWRLTHIFVHVLLPLLFLWFHAWRHILHNETPNFSLLPVCYNPAQQQTHHTGFLLICPKNMHHFIQHSFAFFHHNPSNICRYISVWTLSRYCGKKNPSTALIYIHMIWHIHIQMLWTCL